MAQPIKASGVNAEAVEWLWRERIPRGMITLVAGKPDQGKGMFAAHVAAEVSAAGGRVLYSAAEDDPARMTRPRLEAAGADLDNILLWRFRLPQNGESLGKLLTDCRTPKEKKELIDLPEGQIGPAAKPNPAYQPDPIPIDLVVIDPLASHLSGGISRHSDNVRQVLSPLTELIETTGTSVLIIEHALKRIPTSGHVLDAIGGSGSGVPAAARAAFVFGTDPDDGRRVLAPAKFNIGPWPDSLAFEVDVEELDVVGDVPFLMFDDELQAFDAMRLFTRKTQPGTQVGRPPAKRAAAAEWLTTYLADAGKPVLASVVQEDAKQYGMAAKTLRRAADDMDVVKAPPGGGRNCTWDLPDEVKDMMGLTPPDDDDDVPPVNPAVEITDDDLAELLGTPPDDDDEGLVVNGGGS